MCVCVFFLQLKYQNIVYKTLIVLIIATPVKYVCTIMYLSIPKPLVLFGVEKAVSTVAL